MFPRLAPGVQDRILEHLQICRQASAATAMIQRQLNGQFDVTESHTVQVNLTSIVTESHTVQVNLTSIISQWFWTFLDEIRNLRMAPNLSQGN